MARGGLISRRAAAFSGDARLVLAPCGKSVSIYSTATGEHIGALVGHSGEVTSVILNPENDGQVRALYKRG